MCTTKHYLHALEKEIELRLNGFQTTLFEGKYLEKDRHGFKYVMTESNRTNAKFEDIQNSFVQAVKKGINFTSVYMVPENRVPRVELDPDNQIALERISVEEGKNTGKKTVYFWTKKLIKEGHILCIPPSTVQIAAEIAVMEHVSGERGDLGVAARHEVSNFESLYGIPKKIPEALASIMQKGELDLPSFTPTELVDDDYYILKDNERPGNDEQRKFVCNALSTPDFTIKVGPPGSGKTTAIIELIIQMVKRGKRILLVASTNVAVDNILEKLKDHLDLTCVKRYGCEDNPNISNDAKKFINGKPFMKTEARALQERLKRVPEDKRTAVQQELLEHSDVKDNQLLYELLQENTPIVAGTTFGASLEVMRRLGLKGIEEPPFDCLILDEASKTTIQEFLVPACLCKHWIIVGDIQQLPPYVSDDDLAENLQICYPDDSDKEREYTVASDSLLMSAGKQMRQTVLLVEKESEMDAYLYKEYAKKYNILFADADKPEYDDVLPYATVIVGTLPSLKEKRDMIAPRVTTVRVARDKNTGRILHAEGMQEWVAAARYNREKLFDRYDENEPKEWHDEISWRLIRMFEQRDNDVNADKSTLTRLKEEVDQMIPEGDAEACKKRIRIFEQIYLPSCMELLSRGYGEYRDLALFRGIPEKMLDERCVKLSYQHRCHPQIAQLASDEFYDGMAMRSEHMDGKREWPYRRFGKNHVHWENIRGRCDHKNRNRNEQRWITNELEKFREFAKAKPKKDGKWSVAVLSFYKEQAEELKNVCLRVFKDCSKFVTFSVGSVDSFQGHEADIVFLSYSNQVATCFIGAPNRLNVAITRARYMMVNVGNWRAMSKGQGALGRIVQKLKNVTHNL